MEKWICKTCGTQFPPSAQPPEACPICRDERQYVGYNGQQWTTLAQMRNDGFRNEFKEHEPGLTGIGTTPTFAIGERALLVQSAQGNVLWDCMSLIDDETVLGIERLGGLTAIAISPYSGAEAPAFTPVEEAPPLSRARHSRIHQHVARGNNSSH
jgi:hypothetical protein